MINKCYDEKIKAWLEQNRDRVMENWMDLIRIPSVQTAPAGPKASFGLASAEALKRAAALLEERGVQIGRAHV